LRHYPYKSYPIDLNNDSYIDIVTLNNSIVSGHIHILYNDGNSNFLETSPTPNVDNYHIGSKIGLSCYPNLFREVTTINIKVETPLFNPKIEIYNIKGQKVKTLVRGEQLKGKHSVVWNGTDDSGRQVSSGIYFSKLITSGKVITSKMVMLK